MSAGIQTTSNPTQATQSISKGKSQGKGKGTRTRTTCPDGYLPLHRRVKIGKGEKDFERASQYLLSFGMTNDLSWAEVVVDDEAEVSL